VAKPMPSSLRCAKTSLGGPAYCEVTLANALLGDDEVWA
jgi:hypothetical protein